MEKPIDKAVPKNLRLRISVIKKIEKLAEKENRSFNNMVETILLQYKG